MQISCFPKDIPENIEVDVTNLDIGNSIHISEIKIPNDIELSTGDKEHDTAVVSCYMPKEEKIEEEVKPDETEEAAEGAEAEAEGEAKEGKTEAAKEEEQTDQKAEKSDSKKD